MKTAKRPFHALAAREKIRAFQLVQRLQKCAMGEIDLTISQIRAIEILLKKCLPDLLQQEMTTLNVHRYVVEIPATLARDAWLEKYGTKTIEAKAEEVLELPSLKEIRQ